MADGCFLLLVAKVFLFVDIFATILLLYSLQRGRTTCLLKACTLWNYAHKAFYSYNQQIEACIVDQEYMPQPMYDGTQTNTFET